MTSPSTIRRFIGVYEANGTLSGELAYLLRRGIGGQHCSLCDITHGRVRERPDWRQARARLPVPFDLYHRNDQPAAVRAAADGRFPVVVAELTDGRIEVVLDEAALDECGGSPDRMVDQLLKLTAE